MSDIVSRMKEIIKMTCSGNAREFSRKTEIPYGTLQGYLRGRLPHSEHLIRMSEQVGANINWVLTGKGEMFGIEAIMMPSQQDDFDIDMEVLHRILKWVEEWLDSKNKSLTPDKKARFVALAYKYFTTPRDDGKGRNMNDKDMNNWLRLVV